MKKVLIIGSVGSESHENSVRNYYLEQCATDQVDIAEIGAGTPSGNIVTYQDDIAGCVSYAIANGYNIIVRSYTGVWVFKLEWDVAAANGILVVNAHGGNSHVNTNSGYDVFQNVVLCGAGTSASGNASSYGSDLEFFDTPAEVQSAPFAESWATPIIAAKLSQVMQAKNCTFREARFLYTRTTASLAGSWTPENGFGIIDVAAAIALQIKKYERILKGIV
jgi:hypothetical protein